MSAPGRPSTVHRQDRLLVVEALAYWASRHGSLSRPAETSDRRAHRAAELAAALLAAEGVEGSVREAIDEEWDGTDGRDAGVEYVLGLPESATREAEEADA
ncbi:hypothetical protein BRC86_09305 [Halobacteriales archaeon QS_3_64_16]|nr:MAG: hypothetical protein BRC86_09305 [Halobacteriales archaeon QS_3_64_16]